MTVINASRRSEQVLGAPLTLPCGAVLPNRLAKAAMSEQLADREGRPTDRLVRLYSRWAEGGGAGLLITGNVLVDRHQPVEAYNVVIDRETDGEALDGLARWAAAARAGGAPVLLQLNHPGRQVPRLYNPRPVAPSQVRPRVARGAFATPRELRSDEILDLIGRFARAAGVAERAGFDGVEIHAAHGYLFSQFLSPLTNRRTDGWGGSPEGRRRFLLETVRAVRSSVAADFTVGVKLNSADFQRGGFSLDDSMAVIEALNHEGVDLLEVTGGNLEAPVMQGELPRRRSTTEREAYFLAYARRVRAVAKMPLMLTGGLRTAGVMGEVVREGAVDIVGLARPLALVPDLAARVLAGEQVPATRQPRRTGWRLWDMALDSAWHTQQLHALSRGANPDPRRGLLRTAAAMYATAIRWRWGGQR